MNELKELCQTTLVNKVPARRRRWWQRPKRQLQGRIRRRAVHFYQLRRGQGRTLAQIAGTLRLRSRTLRHWDYCWRQKNRTVRLLGRPPVRSDYRQRNQVIEVLKMAGPTLGVPALRDIFPAMARAELNELAQRYRRVLHERYHDTLRVCHWPIAGRVWAMDLAEPSECGADESLPPIDGCCPYLLAVRDLATGYQLAWLPLKEATAESVRSILAYLFVTHGAPLVLKSDNGSQFLAKQMKAFLEEAAVIPLYSPLHWPAYNGSIEAGIGSLKWRTRLQAARQERIEQWTWDDVMAALREANARRVTAWTSRTMVPNLERVRFELTLQRERMLERTQLGIGWEEELDHWDHSAVDRKAIDRALVAHGYLLYSRRRIPLRIKS